MKLLIAQNLKKLIKERDITVAQLSRSTGVPQQTLSNWLLGLEPRNLNQVKIIAKYFKVSIDYLAYGEEPKQELHKLDDYKEEIYAGIFEVVLRRKE